VSILDALPFELRLEIEQSIAAGDCTRAEAERAIEHMSELADRELAGEVTHAAALFEIIEQAFEVVRRRGS
jgi:hypothetical protein